MQYAIPIPRREGLNNRGRRIYLPGPTDLQVQALSSSVASAIGEGFISLSAVHGDEATTITIEWVEVDPAAEVASIDAAIGAFAGGL
jgi:hypothetical protein